MARAATAIADLGETADSESVRLSANKAVFSTMISVSKFTLLEKRMNEIEEILHARTGIPGCAGIRLVNETLPQLKRQQHLDKTSSVACRRSFVFLGYLFASALARIRCTPARQRGFEKCITGSRQDVMACAWFQSRRPQNPVRFRVAPSLRWFEVFLLYCAPRRGGRRVSHRL